MRKCQTGNQQSKNKKTETIKRCRQAIENGGAKGELGTNHTASNAEKETKTAARGIKERWANQEIKGR